MLRFTLRTALIGIFSIIAVVTACFSYLTTSSIGSMNNSTAEIAQIWLPSVVVTKDIKSEMYRSRIAYAGHITSLNPGALAVAEVAVKNGNATFKEATAKYVPLISSTHERELLNRINGNYDAYVKVGEGMLALSRANKKENATKLFSTDMLMIANQAVSDIDELIDINLNGASKAVATAETTYSSTLTFVCSVIAIIGVMIAVAAFYVIRGGINPTWLIASAHLAEGNTGKAIPYAGRADEIGEVAGAIENRQAASISNKRLEQEAEATRARAEAYRIRLTAEAEDAAQKRLQEATSGLVAGLRRLVEETNAARATLANEAGRLRELISHSQVGGNSLSQAATLRQAGRPWHLRAELRPLPMPCRMATRP